MNIIKKLWLEIYDGVANDSEKFVDDFIRNLDKIKKNVEFESIDPLWYKDSVVYSLYVDLYAKNFTNLIEKLDYLEELGVDCLWLLPILGSPMKDAGFDISDFYHIRADLLNLEENAPNEVQQAKFQKFIDEIQKRNIKVIFDLPMNHISNEHPWFIDAATGKDSTYRDYFIWSDTDELYSDARIIFKGMQDSNWEWHEPTGQYYFHRFFDVQPDLNYRNPKVLIEMTNVLVYWKTQGINGFRADAVPYLWKEEGSICENEYKTHLIVQFFRAVLDYLAPGTMLLAEACQPPKEVVNYFGEGLECNAAYHFPVMPRIYKAMAEGRRDAILETLHHSVTPKIPDNSQWLMFLRVHDELTLEMVTPEERKFIHENYCHKSEWDFRLGEGISARFAELFKFDLDKMNLANSILLTLLGTPVIYYGDEIAKKNDVEFYNEMFELSGYKDTRNFARGRMNWNEVEEILNDEGHIGYKVYSNLKKMLKIRSTSKAFGRGTYEFIDVYSGSVVNEEVLAYKRSYEDEMVIVLQNLSDKTQNFKIDINISSSIDMLGKKITVNNNEIELAPLEYLWIRKS